MAQRKSSSKGSPCDRTVYSEFGGSNHAALARAQPDLPPEKQQLRVQASRKGRKGKTVTVISGFQQAPERLNALAKTLKGKCGSGGTVKDNTIEIQGDHADQLVQLLSQQGYPAKASGR
ncbi:hypothetical protein XM38_012120 [Halomicronema hongdechloris C2206]|uniref:SUI1 domain-containing protein n=1 Tax=Halomicronema hongdechloris C2206 TaxID=1641165 RepID=A0A1Z3HJ07_9CYAN|nr:translation initiation factor [Halomicronema hongdechloris]ASC70275.1 hypothetical protein XM38_012120 [Halomicronema hongdechloris C2206]